MNISLNPQLEELIRRKLESGMYNSASEVVREALRLLDERDRLHEAKLERLRADVEDGRRAAREGRAVDADEHRLDALADDIKRRGEERSRTKRAS